MTKRQEKRLLYRFESYAVLSASLTVGNAIVIQSEFESYAVLSASLTDNAIDTSQITFESYAVLSASLTVLPSKFHSDCLRVMLF